MKSADNTHCGEEEDEKAQILKKDPQGFVRLERCKYLEREGVKNINSNQIDKEQEEQETYQLAKVEHIYSSKLRSELILQYDYYRPNMRKNHGYTL